MGNADIPTARHEDLIARLDRIAGCLDKALELATRLMAPSPDPVAAADALMAAMAATEPLPPDAPASGNAPAPISQPTALAAALATAIATTASAPPPAPVSLPAAQPAPV
jgi:hypothetical protein